MERKGFTLVELLIVVAVIAILASLLLPVLDRARAQAKMSTCLANLKQIGMAVHLYLGDFDEFWYPYLRGKPSAAGSTNVGGTWEFLGFLDTLSQLGYLKGRLIFSSSYYMEPGNFYLSNSTGVLHCPCGDERLRESYGALGYWADYGYNGNLGNRSKTPYLKKLSSVKKPAEMMVFFESCHGNPPTPDGTIFDQLFDGTYNDRHPQIKLCNAVFIDGHAKALTRQEFVSACNP